MSAEHIRRPAWIVLCGLLLLACNCHRGPEPGAGNRGPIAARRLSSAYSRTETGQWSEPMMSLWCCTGPSLAARVLSAVA